MLTQAPRRSQFLFQHAAKLAAWVLAALITLAFISQLLLRFWIWPALPSWHQQALTKLEPYLSAQGLRLQSGAFVADWEGWLTPRISMEQVRIVDASGDAQLAIEKVHATLGLESIAMLWRWQPIFSTVTLQSPVVVAEQLAAGAVRLAGFTLDEQAADFRLANWVLRQGSIQAANGKFVWHDRTKERSAEFRDIKLRLNNLAFQHEWSITATPPESLGDPFVFEGDFRHVLLGTPGNLDDWVGEAFLQFDRVSLAEFFSFVHLPAEVPLMVAEGQGAFRARVSVDRGAVEDLTVDLDLSKARVSWGKTASPLLLDQLKGQVQAMIGPRRQTVRVSGLTIQSTQIPEPAAIEKAELIILQRPDTQDRSLSLSVDALDLGSASWLSSHLPLPAAWKAQLAELAPRGRLERLKLSWRESIEGPTGFGLDTSFYQLTLLPGANRPGFTALTGKVSATEAGGSLAINSASSALIFPGVFEEPVMAFDTLEAQMSWSARHLLAPDAAVSASGTPLRPELSFAIKRFEAINSDLKFSVLGSYDWRGEKAGAADLKISVDRVRPDRVYRYVPLQVSQDTRIWLRDALRPGKPFTGVVELSGELSNFPFRDPAHGRFLVKAKAEGASLEPAPGWPLIQGIQADAEFDRHRFRLVARAGAKLNELTLSETRVSIDDLEANHPILSVNGLLSGDLSRLIEATNRSPAQSMLDGFTRDMTGAGPAKLELAMKLDLNDSRQSTLAGRLSLLRAALRPDVHLPEARSLVGEASFSEAGLRSLSFRGQMLGGEMSLSGGAPSRDRISVGIQGMASGPGIEEWVKGAVGTSIRDTLVGTTPYSVQLERQGKTIESRIRASLVGLRSDLPRPLKKQAKEDWGLAIDFFQGEGKAPGQPGPQRWVVTSNQQQVNARVNQAPSRGRESVIEIDSANLSGLLTWIPSGAAQPAAGVEAGARTAKTSGTLQARLTRLWLDASEGDETNAPSSQNDSVAQDWPNVEAAIEDFRVADKRWGRLEVQASPAAASRSWEIKRLAISNSDAVLSGRGQWSMLSGTTKTGWRSRTALSVELDIKNGGELLARSGFPGLVKGTEGKIEGNVNWPGPPTKFSGAQLSGNLKLNLQQGQFLKTEPGIARLLGVLNLQSLSRRVKLDFRDVFSEGFAYERIRGDLQFINGRASTQNLRILGPQASVMLEGSADVGSETQDLRVLVLPEVNAGLASLGYAALANPAIGLGTFLAQYILRNPMREMLSYEYRVTGSWSDPVVETVKREIKTDNPEMKATD